MGKAGATVPPPGQPPDSCRMSRSTFQEAPGQEEVQSVLVPDCTHYVGWAGGGEQELQGVHLQQEEHGTGVWTGHGGRKRRDMGCRSRRGKQK